jgi:23S rRNA (cytidine2498-2'-O)-methyltransferase
MTQLLLLTADPDFSALALDELLRDSPGATTRALLAPGVALIELGEPFLALAERWQSAPPIFVRHIAPVHHQLALQATAEDLASLCALVLAEIAPQLDVHRSLSVQTRLFAQLPYKPFDLNTSLATALNEATGVAINVRRPEQILSVAVATMPDAHLPATMALVGLSYARQNLSDWAGGTRRFARELGQISRAEFKLLEALECFAIRLPAHGVALDLGASPGGWTHVLRQHGQYVTAVDPGELDPRLADDHGVRHKRMTAEAYLDSDPDQFDLIVNDMRMDARDSARLMVAYARLLYPHGFALMTLKLPARRRHNVIDHTFQLLGTAYQLAGARHLFHNRSEITLYLKPLAKDLHAHRIVG